MLDLIRGRKVTAIGAATAIIVGCVLITPAGGFISPGWAMVLGVARGAAQLRDDRLADRGPGSTRRSTCSPPTASRASSASSSSASSPRIAGTGSPTASSTATRRSSGDQALAALAAPAYAFVMTFVLLQADRRGDAAAGDERDEAIGMDVTQHGEEAYVTGEGAILVLPEDGGGQVGVPVPIRG